MKGLLQPRSESTLGTFKMLVNDSVRAEAVVHQVGPNDCFQRFDA